MNRATLLLALLPLLLVGCNERTVPEEPAGGPYGSSCGANADCATGMCLLVAEPFCTSECLDDCTCPAGAACVDTGGGLSVCAPGENSCLTAPSDGGTDADAEPPPVDTGTMMSGGGAGAACASVDDCGEVLSLGGTGPSAERMMLQQQCFPEATSGFPGGLCSITDCVTNFRRDPCPSGTECFNTTRGSVCLVECDRTSDCRAGFTCRADVDPSGPLCWLSCARTGCADGLTCQSDGTCSEIVVTPVDYEVTTRSASLGAALSSVDGMASGGDALSIPLPFDVAFFSETYRSGSRAVASWQGLFAFDRTGIMAFVPGNRTRYEIAAPLIVTHHYENADRTGSRISYRVSGTAPNRALEVEWVTANLSGTGGARFRLRFDEGSPSFTVHYGPITDDVFGGSWTQLAMLDTSQYEETVVSTGSPSPESQANTSFTYTPR